MTLLTMVALAPVSFYTIKWSEISATVRKLITMLRFFIMLIIKKRNYPNKISPKLLPTFKHYLNRWLNQIFVNS